MKKPRSVYLTTKRQTIDDNDKSTGKRRNCSRDDNNKAKSFYELSLSLIFSLWCLVFLFYFKLGLGHGGGGTSPPDNRSTSSPSACINELGEPAYSYIGKGSNTFVNAMSLEFNMSTSCNNSNVSQSLVNSNYSRPKKSSTEVVWTVVGYSALACEIQRQDEKKNQAEQHPSGRTRHTTYLNLDEFRNITRKEEGRASQSQQVNITHRLELDGTAYNYASASKGAKVVAHNKEAKGASNILGEDHDKYLRNPCSAREKFVVIELAEETLVVTVKIANFEHHSSNFKEFELSGSLSYPTEAWSPLGTFVAANAKHAQCFKMPEPKWVRYLKLNLISHFGSEFYCTLSAVEVYGVDAIEQMLEDLIVTSAESVPSKLSEPNSTAMPSLKPEVGPVATEGESEVQNDTKTSGVGTESPNGGQKPNVAAAKTSAILNSIPDPVIEVRQQPNGRIPSDIVLKILLQKVRSLEFNLSVLEEYVKELNRRQGDVLPELDRELSRISLLLEKSREEIKALLEWKESMEKGITDLQLWKVLISSQIEALIGENNMLRLDIEKVVSDQADMESKELAVLAVSLFFVCFAILKLVLAQILSFFGAWQSRKTCQTSRGWVLILVSSSMTIFITFIYS